MPISRVFTAITLALFALPTNGAPIKLSSCPTDANRNVVIGPAPCGPAVYADQSFTGANGFGAITINQGGTLSFPDQTTAVDAAAIVVGGTLQIGDAALPIGSSNPGNVVTLNFTGSQAISSPPATKGITVNSGGTLMLHGRTGVAPQGKSWTYLAAPAGPAAYGTGLGVASPVPAGGDTTLAVADAVDWRAGQWIVVAGTDFSPDGAEFVLISNVACTTGAGCVITLDSRTPLVNYHFGGAAPDLGQAAFQDTFAKNYGIDERAEVGLVSRNIRLTAAVAGTTAYGGEIAILSGFSKVEIQGVEIEKFGKAQLGSYPIHFHLTGTVTPGSVVADSNSIHHSYNKCVALHSTNGITISNNICARAVGHLFYLETGTESGNTFQQNLGIGAMSNAFSIPANNPAAVASFWAGDYMTNAAGIAAGLGNGYNGFNIPFTDSGTVNGTASTPSGFWITNPGPNTFIGNDIAGCQDIGVGFWILPTPTAGTAPIPAGHFARNRAHGCYYGFNTASTGVSGAVNYTPQSSCPSGSNCDVVTTFESLTATRNRNIGIWVRPAWYALTDARVATNRDGISLVSSGGAEGSPPGVWGLLKNSIVAGISANNPNRFGPCPYAGPDGFGGNAGCYETVANQGVGYPVPTPSWNLTGYMFYDGPARLENVHFVNFKKEIASYLTADDLAYLQYYSASNFMPCATGQIPFQYEGDAAMGWFQSNVNSYPPTQYVKGLTYLNVDLRHQIYTQDVEQACAPSGVGGFFRDGDKFTVILDHDRSLTGLQVVGNGTGSPPNPVPGVYPISLNNLPFLAGPGTADECHSIGMIDTVLESRPTSLISPFNYATLELSALSNCSGGTCQNNNILIFTKDQIDYGGTMQFNDVAVPDSGATLTVSCGCTAALAASGVPGHACVALTGRNGQGIYEPKLINGLGYTVGATMGLPPYVSLMYTDASVPGGISSQNPFHTRIGLCYKNAATAPPGSAFTVYKGSKSFGAPNGNNATLSPDFFNLLACTGLENTLCSNLPSCVPAICPSAPFFAGGTASTTKTPLPSVSNIADLQNPTLCPNGECWYYDQSSGLLFLNMVQERPNAGGPYSSPLGTCGGTANGPCADESLYATPAGQAGNTPTAAELYTIQVAAPYTQGPSLCTPYGGTLNYTQNYPSGMNQLAYANGTVIGTKVVALNPAFPHNVLTNEPPDLCPVNAPAIPDWPPAPQSAVPSAFTFGLPRGVTASITGQTAVPNTTIWLLVPGHTYTLTATSGANSCQENITINATTPGFTANDNNCGTGLSGNTNSIPIGAPPWP